MTCPGCPIETPNVVEVGVRVSVESSGGWAAPPTPCVGMLGGCGPLMLLYFFSRLSFGVVVLLRNLKPGSGPGYR